MLPVVRNVQPSTDFQLLSRTAVAPYMVQNALSNYSSIGISFESVSPVKPQSTNTNRWCIWTYRKLNTTYFYKMINYKKFGHTILFLRAIRKIFLEENGGSMGPCSVTQIWKSEILRNHACNNKRTIVFSF